MSGGKTAGKTDIEKHLDGIELVVVGGESDVNARPLDYDWVLDIREQCIRKNVDFEFRQCGTYTIKDGKLYKIQTKDLTKQARLADINFKSKRILPAVLTKPRQLCYDVKAF